jgi:crotonobetainyl-CoA:carnitine CoA-transferase CaiB-like acyl-CoA transferase
VIAPFQGVRIVDLSGSVSGAFSARLFGDFGADVVLAELPQGHALRHEPPFLDDRPGHERSALHTYLNWNKRSFVVEDTRDMADLMSCADVVVTNADPISGAWFAEALDRLRPDAVHLSITPHGLTSQLAGRAGNNLTASARTGWSCINGYLDEPPLQMPRHQAGYVGGVTGFIAAAAALRRREYGDRPELVDVSEIEAFALTVHPWAIAAVYEDSGFSYGPAGGRRRGEPGPLWDAADGRMNFGIGDFRNWPAAMRVLQLPELASREDLIPDVHRHSRDLSAVVAGIARTLPELERWPVFHALAKLRCVIGVLQDIDDIVKDPQLAARRFLVETRIEDRKVRAAGPPAKLSPSPWRLSSPAPRLAGAGASSRWDEAPTGENVHRPPSRSFSAKDLADGPLSGVRVLSFGQAWSGTFGTELLALLGADVVQVSSIHRTDVWRRVRDRVPRGLVDPGRVQHALNTQGLYNSVNLNKREVTLDLGQERGRQILWDLLPRFDILADNFRPTVMPSWGITLEKLHALRPGMIWASISGYGAGGPYREYPANGATTEPMAGLSSLHGYEGDPGMNTGGLYPDPIAGYFFAATVMAALHHRDRTGEPQRIDLSMMEAVATVCGDAIVEYDATGRVPRPMGNHHPRVAPHNNYLAASGEWLALASESEAAWRALVTHIGDERLHDAQFETMGSRKANEAQLDVIIAEWCARQDASEAESTLGALGIAAARVVPFYELYSRPDPNFVASGFVTRVDHPEAGKTWLAGRPWKFSAAPASPLSPSPCVGQHSREVLTAELGISADEYEALVAAGVTGTLDDTPAHSQRIKEPI